MRADIMKGELPFYIIRLAVYWSTIAVSEQFHKWVELEQGTPGQQIAIERALYAFAITNFLLSLAVGFMIAQRICEQGVSYFSRYWQYFNIVYFIMNSIISIATAVTGFIDLSVLRIL